MGSKLGILKVAAKRLRMSFEEYQANLENGLKWCASCKRWRPKEFFGLDKARGDGLRAPCFECSRVKTRKQRKDKAPSKNIQQAASYAVRAAIQRGLLVDPRTLPCINCGKPAVLYHHHLGYERKHFLDVQALCSKCHINDHWE